MHEPKPKCRIELTREEEQFLRQLVSARKSPQGQVPRARILLLKFDHPDWSNQQIACEAACIDWTVRRWRKRWAEKRSIEDLPRAGAPRHYSPSGAGTTHRACLQSTSRERRAAEALGVGWHNQ